jgi:hypothetical protein
VAATEVSFAFAGLGANTFQGTQQIGTGNLDLDLSTAVEGNITKRGTRFLHDRGTRNTFLGGTAGNFTLTGSDNTGTGYRALLNATSGTHNTALGSNAGLNATTGSHNIYLGADVQGTAADVNTLRLGLPYDSGTGAGQNRTFLAGVAGTVLTTPAALVYIDANGQLGTAVPPPPVGGWTATRAPDALALSEAGLQAALDEQRAENAGLKRRLEALEVQVRELARRRPR